MSIEHIQTTNKQSKGVGLQISYLLKAVQRSGRLDIANLSPKGQTRYRLNNSATTRSYIYNNEF